MLSSKGNDPFDLGRRDVFGKDAAQSHAIPVNLEHDPRGTFAVHAEKFLQYNDHEIHGSEVVIEQQNFKERGRLDPRPLWFKHELFLFLGPHESHSNAVGALSNLRPVVAIGGGCKGLALSTAPQLISKLLKNSREWGWPG